VLANVLGDNLAMLRVGVCENVLDEVVAVLITRNINQGNARTIVVTFTDSIKVASKEVDTADLEALLNNLRSELVHAVLGSIADDMVNGSAAISWGTMLADMLNAPVAELSMSDNVDAGKNLLDARALEFLLAGSQIIRDNQHTLSSSRQFSKMFWTTSEPVSPSATSCHMPRRASLTYFMI